MSHVPRRPVALKVKQPSATILLLTLLAGILFFLPEFRFQGLLSLGDHGRDLLCFEAVSKGLTPYKDCWWIYGPLMPYYYAAFFKILGGSISSVLVGEICLKILSGLFVFLIIRRISSPLWAFLASLWYWIFVPSFFYTYNHTGGIACLLGIIYCLVQYIYLSQRRYLNLALVWIFLLCLIKLNFGLASLLGLVVSTMIIDKRRRIPLLARTSFYAFAMVLFPLMIFSFYYFFIHDLSSYTLQQCFPHITGESQITTSFFSPLFSLFKTFVVSFSSLKPQVWMRCLIVLCTLRTFFLIITKRIPEEHRTRISLTILVLIIFSILFSHEFLFSGVRFCLNWVKPLGILLMFLFLGVANQSFSKGTSYAILVLFVLVSAWQISVRAAEMHSLFTPERFLALPKTHVFITNPQRWKNTVEETTQYLKENLKEDDLFLAIPLSPLYYFLTERPSPVYQLSYFKYNNIPLAVEKEIIKDLEKKKVDWIVLSNRSNTSEYGLGNFGETHCRLMTEYILANFETVKSIGKWTKNGGWGWNHAVKILKRKSR